ncbi:hypothetical protein GCM10017782_30120 [Deinococcus ficus]|nr:hypothetical protein GCM10017782_30120 [Deinococcus ficus]
MSQSARLAKANIFDQNYDDPGVPVDWLPVIAFYAALHLTSTVYEYNTGRLAATNHTARRNDYAVLANGMLPIYSKYLRLQEISEYQRYGIGAHEAMTQALIDEAHAHYLDIYGWCKATLPSGWVP